MSLAQTDHQALALWAADCAERVLPRFEERYPDDDRPRKAVEAARAWARGDLTTGQARAAALAAHDAARDTDPASDAARAAARATGHAAATAHVADHAKQASAYALKAVTYGAAPGNAAAAMADERERQRERLPAGLRSWVFPDQG